MMPYFQQDYIEFFKELAPNNHKDWFDENRKRYTNNVKEPFKTFVADLIENLSSKNSKFKGLEPKDCIFRINRDIRFSKDKTPYKLNLSALVAVGGRKNYTSEGLYVELGPEHARVYSGLYETNKEQLYAIREGISEDIETFQKLYSDKSFESTFGTIRGEQNKIIPKEFKEAAEKEPLIYNKQFYYFAEFEPEVICEENFMERVLSCYDDARPLEKYFTKILNR